MLLIDAYVTNLTTIKQTLKTTSQLLLMLTANQDMVIQKNIKIIFKYSGYLKDADDLSRQQLIN